MSITDTFTMKVESRPEGAMLSCVPSSSELSSLDHIQIQIDSCFRETVPGLEIGKQNSKTREQRSKYGFHTLAKFRSNNTKKVSNLRLCYKDGGFPRTKIGRKVT